MTETVTIHHNGTPLDAVFTTPHGREAGPLCILVHGITGWKDERHLLALEQALLEAEVAVLRADLYGHGKSGGAFRDHTLDKWVGNILALMDYARGLAYTGDILLCGHSQGGLAVMLAAGRRPDAVEALIPLSPAWKIPEWIRTGSLRGISFDPTHLPEEVPIKAGYILGSEYLRVAQTIRVEEAIACYRGQVLLIHGEEDQSVPVEDSRALAKLYQNCTFLPLPGDDHGYHRHLDVVTAKVKEWVKGLDV